MPSWKFCKTVSTTTDTCYSHKIRGWGFLIQSSGKSCKFENACSNPWSQDVCLCKIIFGCSITSFHPNIANSKIFMCLNLVFKPCHAVWDSEKILLHWALQFISQRTKWRCQGMIDNKFFCDHEVTILLVHVHTWSSFYGIWVWFYAWILTSHFLLL